MTNRENITSAFFTIMETAQDYHNANMTGRPFNEDEIIDAVAAIKDAVNEIIAVLPVEV